MGRHIFRRFLAIIALFLLAASSLCAAGAGGGGTEMLLSAQGVAGSPAQAESQEIESLQGIEAPSFGQDSLLDKPQVQSLIAYYSSKSGIRYISGVLDQARPFRSFIVGSIAAASLPPEILYLAFVESEFQVDAVSKSGAAGIWQFMKASSAGLVTRSEWQDGRYDFWESTSGAVSKLAYNYSQTGDWLLAIAAYNAGLGRVQRILKAFPGSDFWKLLANKKSGLPAETRDYVPRFLAISYVAGHPGRFGLPIDWDNEIEWVKIPAFPGLDVAKIEREASIPAGVLEMGNAELLYGITPPRQAFIKVPKQYSDAVANILRSSKGQPNFLLHTVVKGDTIYALARKYKTNEDLILQYNPGIVPGRLKLAQRIIIPLLESTKLAETLTSEDSRQ